MAPKISLPRSGAQIRLCGGGAEFLGEGRGVARVVAGMIDDDGLVVGHDPADHALAHGNRAALDLGRCRPGGGAELQLVGFGAAQGDRAGPGTDRAHGLPQGPFEQVFEVEIDAHELFDLEENIELVGLFLQLLLSFRGARRSCGPPSDRAWLFSIATAAWPDSAVRSSSSSSVNGPPFLLRTCSTPTMTPWLLRIGAHKIERRAIARARIHRRLKRVSFVGVGDVDDVARLGHPAGHSLADVQANLEEVIALQHFGPQLVALVGEQV